MDPRDLDEYLESTVRFDAVPDGSERATDDVTLLRHAVIGIWTVAAFLFATLLFISRS